MGGILGGGGGGFLDWNSKGVKRWGGRGDLMQFGNPNAWGNSALNFQRGKTVKALLEIADLLTVPVCKSSSMN